MAVSSRCVLLRGSCKRGAQQCTGWGDRFPGVEIVTAEAYADIAETLPIDSGRRV